MVFCIILLGFAGAIILMMLSYQSSLKEDRDYWKKLCDERTDMVKQALDKITHQRDNIRRLRNAVINKSKGK